MTARKRFDAQPILDGLKDFQLNTVAHIMDRFYGEDPTTRFLVADETGLGKSIVARGVIAGMIEKLQDTKSINRIDVVYVCSNLDLARQNLARLDVVKQGSVPFTSRLSLLATESARLNEDDGQWRKPIKLVSFTPGTSFDPGWSTGTYRERALLFLLLREPADLSGARKTAGLRVLQAGVSSWTSFRDSVDNLELSLAAHGVDQQIASRFLREVRRDETGVGSLLSRFEQVVDATVHRDRVLPHLMDEVRSITGRMRAVLAKAGVDTLEPDLVILDEFQRFRDLLSEDSEAGQLAHELFNHGDARVLLLSATPFKPYTLAEEGAGEGHREGFIETLRFLAGGCPSADVDGVATLLDELRGAMTMDPSNARGLNDEIRDRLLAVMCRTERPEQVLGSQVAERSLDADPVDPADMVSYVRVKQLADHVGGQFPLEYWKSVPCFPNFMEGYEVWTKVGARMANPQHAENVQPLIAALPTLDPEALSQFGSVDPGNGRFRRLAAETVGAGWANLLWVPPTLPYLEPGPPFDDPAVRGMTKRLVFSSWRATPTAVASLLSYEASRAIAARSSRDMENTPDARRRLGRRLSYRMVDGRPASMTTLALFWPMVGLASLGDPLALAHAAGAAPTQQEAVADVAGAITSQLADPTMLGFGSGESWYWAAAFRWPTGLRVSAGREEVVREIIVAMSGLEGEPGDADADTTALAEHVKLALDVPEPDGIRPDDLAQVLAELALHSPANCAWRALGRLDSEASTVTPLGRVRAAAVLASGVRSMFNRWESTLLLDTLNPDLPHWRAVLHYCASGNLQAVLDEYVFHLADAEGVHTFTDESLLDLAHTAASAISVRSATYRAVNPRNPDEPISFQSRFALRYSGGRDRDESMRPGEVRQAFNSPFWPFVLATTSIGQEGIDFHWWCHSLVHWNTPPNPVDFEQREGRVNRFRGHAIRKNIIEHHGPAILADQRGNPWAAAYEIASSGNRLGGLRPDWIHEGSARIDRCMLPYPMSIDRGNFDRMKRELALYRLAFGQSRQEDLVELMRLNGIGDRPKDIERLRIDLRAPERDRR